ncbi:MAG: sensor domain-containing diguanylate cyclase [Deltaproteobacteria bacterium]|nr:sensor domain-containing diguanylate cyclase [Deltaproteobacteria bacterium]
MTDRLHVLTELVYELQIPRELDEILESIVEHAAVLVETQRVSIRLLDPSRTKLIASVRAGTPLHEDPSVEFRLGEGLMGWIAKHARPIRSGNATMDRRFAHRPGMKDEMGSFIGVPLLAGSVCMGVLSAVHEQEHYFSEEHEQVMLLVAGICGPYLEIARLSRLARVDPLTGALNRRGLEGAFPDEPIDDSGIVRPLSVVITDVDRFKEINDRFGHAVGDEAIKGVAQLLSTVLRVGDAVVRYGGDEFVLLLPGVDLAQAGRIAERAQEMIQKLEIDLGEMKLKLTASMGVAERLSGESRGDLIKRADEALYEAKQAGRNRVRLAEKKPSPPHP